MSRKAVVLSSGGIDSTTALAIAIREFGTANVSTVSVDYGQKHRKELECAEKIAKYYQVDHYVLDLSEVFKNCQNPLMSNSLKEIPLESYADQQKHSESGIVETYIPYRNGTMLSAVTSYAMSIYPDDTIELFLGNHADDAAGNAYPDCSVEFSDAVAAAINYGTGGRVVVSTPFVTLTKSQIVAKGLELNVPYELTWSCYNGGDKACGKCGTCRDRIQAFIDNNAIDPIGYEDSSIFEEKLKPYRTFDGLKINEDGTWTTFVDAARDTMIPKMYKVSKRMEIAGAHKLNLTYESKCGDLHGHNWIITVYCKSHKLDENGMVVDFAKVKEAVHGYLDHSYINEALPTGMNPTAENIAEWVCNRVSKICKVGKCYKVEVQESEGNIAVFERD